MNNIYIWLILGVASIIFGILSRIAAYHVKSKVWWFFEVWRDVVSYFITGVIGYFLVAIRWPKITESGNLSVGDFVLCLVFFMGVLGWLPIFIKNVTEGINAIIERIIGK